MDDTNTQGRHCYIVTVGDTVTYQRRVEITVWADDKDEAMGLALDGADDAMGSGESVEEEQIDNTPYTVIAIHD